MKQRLLWSVIVTMPLLIMAQEKSGINWTTGLTWQQVVEKAKKENKYIFVDCFTTWCGPCKRMDKEVYTIDSVGNYLNEGFLSVKLQMDVTAKDNAEVKSWYKTARDIERQYRINSYPSYLFFSPGGEIVSKNGGYKQAGEFMQVVRDVANPSKQYFVLLNKYRKGKLDHASTVYLIKQAQQIGDTSDYNHLLSDYYSRLNKLKKEKLYTQENIEFVASTLENSHQLLFKMFYPNGSEVNKAMKNDWYAKKLVDKIIIAEKVNPFLATAKRTKEPDWNVLYNSIVKDFNAEYAGRNVLNAKIGWHGADNNPLLWATFFNDKMEQYGTDTTSMGEDFKLNNTAYMVFFKNITDTAQLNRAIKWMEGVVRRGIRTTGPEAGDWAGDYPLYIDTYANLLHKVGRTTEAIKWEEVALNEGKELHIGAGDLKTIEDCLNRMKKGEATWGTEDSK